MKIVFINSSPNKDGNTASLASTLLKGHEYTTISLTDYQINPYGSTLPGDEFTKVIDSLNDADVVVMGSPVYWHNICGTLRTFIDRFYGSVEDNAFSSDFYFIFQGAAPEKWMNEAAEYTMKRFAAMYGFTYKGMITNQKEAVKAQF